MKRGPVFFSAARMGERQRPLGAIFLLVVAVVIGGGHIEGPIRNGLIEAIAVGLMLSLAWRQWREPSLPQSATAPLILWLTVLGLFLLMLVPLPPAMSPGGRAMTDAVRALHGVPVRWRPLSLDPAGTIRMAASLLVPIAMTFATLRAGPNGRMMLIQTLLLLMTVSALLGMAQLALGSPAWATPFGKSDPGVADGLFVNRNHQSMFMLAGLIASGLLIRIEASARSVFRVAVGRRQRLHLAWLLMPLFTLMTIASASRAGIALLVLVLPAAIMLALHGKQDASHTAFPRWIAALLVALFVAALAFALLPAESIATVRSRMIFSGGTRIDVLPDLATLIGQYWPWGSGPGTFVPTFKGIEDLDKLGPAYLNHAHNEYLEWASESGLPGVVVLAAVAATLLTRLWIVLGSSRSDNRKALTLGGAGILLLLAGHSAIDYPLRTDAHAALFGLALGLLFTPALDPPVAAASVAPRRAPLVMSLLVLLGFGFSARILQLRIAEVAAGDANAALSDTVHSDDGFANAYVAQERLAAGRPTEARRLALAAIDDTPLSVVAVRTLALAEERLGNRAAGRDAWRAAAGMGWRDVATQYWAMQQALVDGQNAIAGMRADALLRTSEGLGPLADLTRRALGNPGLRHALVARMAIRPGWRQNFFFVGRPLEDAELPGLIATLGELKRTAAPPTRVEARDTILALLNRGRIAEAVALDRPFDRLRRRDPGSLIDDGDFQRSLADYQGGTTPFDWSMLGVSHNSATLDESAERAMFVTTDGSIGLSSLRRWLALAPGRYRLDYRMRGAAEAPSGIGVWVTCPPSSSPLAQSSGDALASDSFELRSLAFEIPSSCPVVILSIGGIAMQAAEAAFTGFRLIRVAQLPPSALRR